MGKFFLTIGLILIVNLPEAEARNGLTNQRSIAQKTRVHASYYGKGFDGKPMANRKIFHRLQPTVASNTLPLGTKVLITNPENGKSATATVTDKGKFEKYGRQLDVSEGLAIVLGFKKKGHTDLILAVLSVPERKKTTS